MNLWITRRAHYAMLILYHLACLPAEQRTNAESIADALSVPSSTTRVVIRHLSLAGLVQTTRGSQGGVSLARDPADISVLEVLQIMDGPIVLNECISGHDGREPGRECPMCQTWHEAQEALENQLRYATFEQFCSNLAVD